MKVERPYLKSSLTINEIGEKLTIPSRHVSQIINETFHQNFLDFINCYLIEESKSFRLTAASFSPDGERILTASFDRTAALWNLNGELLATYSGHSDEINQAEFSSNGQYILTAGEDATAKLWSLNGSLIKSFGENDQVDYTSATFSMDGNFAIVSSKSHAIDFWYLPE